MFVAKCIEGTSAGYEDVLLLRQEMQSYANADYCAKEMPELACFHVVVYEKKKAVATMSMYASGDDYWIGLPCISPDFSEEHYDDLMIRMLCNRAMESNPSALIFSDVGEELRLVYQAIGFVQEENQPKENSLQTMVLRPGNFLKPCQQ